MAHNTHTKQYLLFYYVAPLPWLGIEGDFYRGFPRAFDSLTLVAGTQAPTAIIVTQLRCKRSES